MKLLSDFTSVKPIVAIFDLIFHCKDLGATRSGRLHFKVYTLEVLQNLNERLLSDSVDTVECRRRKEFSYTKTVI